MEIATSLLFGGILVFLIVISIILIKNIIKLLLTVFLLIIFISLVFGAFYYSDALGVKQKIQKSVVLLKDGDAITLGYIITPKGGQGISKDQLDKISLAIKEGKPIDLREILLTTEKYNLYEIDVKSIIGAKKEIIYKGNSIKNKFVLELLKYSDNQTYESSADLFGIVVRQYLLENPIKLYTELKSNNIKEHIQVQNEERKIGDENWESLIE